jgi:hypothetical protein
MPELAVGNIQNRPVAFHGYDAIPRGRTVFEEKIGKRKRATPVVIATPEIKAARNWDEYKQKQHGKK